MIVGFLIYGLILAAVLALWEIQIEGQHGWAEKLPTWRIEKGWIVKIWGGRPVTGYHTFMNIFLILMIHFPFFFTSWSVRKELFIIGFFIALLLVEDWLWFVFNPAYGLKKFRKGMIWWHPHWWGPVPDYYWLAALISGLLICFGSTI